MTDFWRLRPDPATFSGSDDETGGAKIAESLPRPGAFAPAARPTSVEAAAVVAQAAPAWALEVHSARAFDLRGLLGDLEESLGVDEAALCETSCPVALGSLASYLARLRLVGPDVTGEAALLRRLPAATGTLPQLWAAGRLAECYGRAAVPRELWGCFASTEAAGFPTELRFGTDAGSQVSAWSGVARAGWWRQLYAGSVLQPDEALCGRIAPVPELPNPFTVISDVPRFVEGMLAEVPKDQWDTKCCRPPLAVAGFPHLYRGLGGLLPSATPRELAHNMVAAAILNRLCGNWLTSMAIVARATESERTVTAEEQAVAAAKAAVKAKVNELQQAKLEESTATRELREFRASCGTDMKQAHYLESMEGWKSSARGQAERDVEAAQKELKAAENALAASRKQVQIPPWHAQWPGPVPPEAASEAIFHVRLTSKAPLVCTVKEFLEAMGSGIQDRIGSSGMVGKHKLEASFARQACDLLLLCTCDSDKEEAAKLYTHLPAPATADTGFARQPKDTPAHGARAPQPRHAFRLSVSGTTFPFEVSLAALVQAGGALAFAGAWAHPETLATPWNPLDREAHDTFWDWETKECMDLIPLICSIAALAGDPELPLGVLPPAARPTEGAAPVGAAGLALLQAVLHTSVKMWPVSLPDDVRVRWDYVLRVARHTLGRCKDKINEDDIAIDRLLNDDLISRCLKALKEVPNDGGCSAGGGCHGFGHRLQRMQQSALSRVPLKGAVALRAAVAEIGELWPKFLEETDV